MAERPVSLTPPTALPRPGVLSLNIREKAALYAAYMPFLKGGGIFIPTSRDYRLGEEVFMLLSLMDDPNRIAVQGKVVWITPEGVQGNGPLFGASRDAALRRCDFFVMTSRFEGVRPISSFTRWKRA